MHRRQETENYSNSGTKCTIGITFTFNGKLRDELLDREIFTTLTEAFGFIYSLKDYRSITLL
jgi:hypothetical protein